MVITANQIILLVAILSQILMKAAGALMKKDGIDITAEIAEIEKAVREAALQAARENIVLARKGLIPPNDTLLKEIKASGVNVSSLTPKEKEAFKKASRSVYDKWAKQIGPELVKKAEQAVAKRK